MTANKYKSRMERIGQGFIKSGEIVLDELLLQKVQGRIENHNAVKAK